MGVQLNLKDIQSGFLTAAAHTSNNTLIEQAMNKALDRTNSVDNAMEVDLDMGLNDLFNADRVLAKSVVIDGVTVNPTTSTSIEDFQITTGTGTQDLADAIDDRVIRLNDMTSFQNVAVVNLINNQQFSTIGYHPDTDVGGGDWYYDSSRLKSNHDGGMVISPTVPWDGTKATLADFLNGVGETDPAGTGVFVRKTKFNRYTPQMFGATGSPTGDDTAAISALISAVPVGEHGLLEGEPGSTYVLSSRVTTGPLDDKKVSFRGYGCVIHLKDTGGVNLRSSDGFFEGFVITQDPAVVKSRTYAIDILDIHDVRVSKCIFFDLKYAAINIRASLNNCNNITITDNRFIRCSSNDIAMSGSSATELVKDVTISNNIHESPTDPLGSGNTQIRAVHVVSWAKHVTVDSCQMKGVALADYTSGWRDGVMIGNSSATGRPEDIVVSNCQITGMSDDAVGISGAVRVIVDSCVLYGSKVTSGVYVPGDGTWSNDDVKVSNTISYDHFLAGIFLKDTINYSVTDCTITNCDRGVSVVDNGVGVLGGQVSYNTIRDCLKGGIAAVGSDGVEVHGNHLKSCGDPASATVTDKQAIRVQAAGSYKGNNIVDSPIALLYTSSPTNFVVEGNTGSAVVDVHQFTGFSGDRYIVANNVIGRTGALFLNQPAASATKIYKDNL